LSSDDVQLTLDFEAQLFIVGAGVRDTALCKQVPGMFARKDSVTDAAVVWRCPATWYHANVLRRVFGARLTYGQDIAQWAAAELAAEQARLAIKDMPVGDDGPLYTYQKRGVNWMFGTSAILADDMGLGKTVQALTALEVTTDREFGDTRDAVVVSTNAMLFKWAEEARIWAPSWNPVVVTGTADKRRKLIESAPPHSLFIVGWGSLRTHTRVAGYGSVSLTPEERQPKDLNHRNIAFVIADESHKAKDPKAKQTRALWHLADHATAVYPLTGTPVQNAYLDLWSQLRLVAPIEFANRGAFQDRYVFGFETDYGFQPVGWRAENKDELFRFVDQYLLRRTKDEVGLDLPPKTYDRRLIELTTAQAKAYKAMKKEALAEFDGALLTAADPLTKAMRLSQIASAVPVVEDGKVVALEDPSNKLDALVEILDEGDGQLVVFAASKKLINLAEARLDKKKVSSVRITGDESPEVRGLHVQQFQEGLARVALCTFGAGSEGITLTAASTAVFLQRPWSLVQSRQAEDRIHRIGQKSESVVIIDLVSKGTVDVGVHQTLVVKGEVFESVTRDKARLRAMIEED